ncbi:hypothetical protein N7541_003890 [Penicillium brevicompactum]|uniref:Uncharacterized protein n=1 Tax=Penicillium brevicompactum TaxID=5074 RepID=A0A9W9RMN3_PENBR|nr:hypothetical protein N7541_003890 [Penicillium brevicompactum]
MLVILPVANAGGWEDFSNNLATDLAPFLSLFGEQITQQYLSESISKIDYFIFAMAPMGILTGVVSAIRVRGTPSLRAFIGRAQEGAGNAEAELCTSTSRDVCELYNNGGIARVFGRPKMLEIIHDPDHDFDNPPNDKAGIYTFHEYVTEKPNTPWEEKEKIEKHSTTCKIKQHDVESKITEQLGPPPPTFAPNLSLNIGIKKQPDYVFKLIAAGGLSLQAGVLAFAGFATYYLKWGNDDKPPEPYACPLMIIGTFLVCGGMYHCAFLIGQSTRKDIWTRKKNHADISSMYWVQPGDQIVGDQTFDAFCYTDRGNPLQTYMTSKRDMGSNEPRLGIWIAIGTTISGFILQFTGLRGIHSAVIIAQLGAIIIMSIARAALRMQRLEPSDNSFAGFPDEVLGHELDWLAMRIGRDTIERDIEGLYKDTENAMDGDNKSPLTSLSSSQPPLKSTFSRPSSNVQRRHFWRIDNAIDARRPSIQFSTPMHPHNAAATLLAYRTRLAALTDSSTLSATSTREFKTEMVEVRTESRKLGGLVEATFREILSKATIKKDWIAKMNGSQSIFWSISCSLSDAASIDMKKHVIYIELVREDPSVKGSPWIIKDQRMLEGILGLWAWSLKSDPAIEVQDPDTGLTKSLASNVQARRVISSDQMNQSDLGMWLGEDINNITKYDIKSLTEHNTNQQRMPFDSNSAHDASEVWRKIENAGEKVNNKMHPTTQSREQLFRFFGWNAANISRDRVSMQSCLWSAPVKGSLVSACAQEVFVSFLVSVFDIVEDFGPVNVQEGETFRLENSLLTDILGLFTEMGLGSRQEALVCLVPLIIPCLEVPSAEGALVAAREAATKHRRCENWKKAEKLLRWAWNICTRSGSSCETMGVEFQGHIPVSGNELERQATVALCELYRWALIEGNQRAFGQYGISWLNEQKPSQSVSTCETIDHYVFVAEKIAQHLPSDTDLAAMEKKSLSTALLFVTCPPSQIERTQKGTALCLAAQHGWNEVVFALLELKIEPDFQDAEGRTALSYAAENGNVNVVRECLTWGSFPDLRDSKQRTALSHAAEAGANTVTELLLKDIRVSPDQRDWHERTPLHWAAMNGHSTIIEQIWETTHSVSLEGKGKDGLTPLLLAAVNGHTSTVQWLLAKVDTETKDPSGRTPLSWAAANGHDSTVECLLAKADPNAQDPSGRTPLSWAAANGHDSTVECLLAMADPNAQDPSGRTPLSWAAGNGHVSTVERLLAKGYLNMKDKFGQTPLSWASKHGHMSIVELLLFNEADPSVKTNDGDTPLSLAAENGHGLIVETLLAKNCDPNTVNEKNLTPLHQAGRNGHGSIVKSLLASNAHPEINPHYRTPLSFAAGNGHLDVVKTLLASNAHPDRNDRTPLSYAAQNGHVAVVECLLASKADPNSRDYSQRTPLLLASQTGCVPVVACLLASKADPNIKGEHGITPLLSAAKQGYHLVIECLLASNVDPNTRDDHGRSPLLWAALEGHRSAVECLLANGIDPNTKDNFGRTPLLAAAKDGHWAVVQCLLANGADPNISDDSGNTPLGLGAEDGSLPVVKPLVENNAKIDTCNNSGDTPLLLAAKGRYDYVVNYLVANGADFNMSNKVGETPLFWSKHWHDTWSLEVLEEAMKKKAANSGG